ncbi:hypothetical protein N9137_04275, partial [Pseudomonadales bacterium]|nr:hypothetical protein [Pseudomonadales bacterium]
CAEWRFDLADLMDLNKAICGPSIVRRNSALTGFRYARQNEACHCYGPISNHRLKNIEQSDYG